jgi:hypothetical protein
MTAEPTGPVVYQIRLEGRLHERWSDWLYDMAITYQGGVTTLTGPLPDQAALRGLLGRIWDLNFALISVARL